MLIRSKPANNAHEDIAMTPIHTIVHPTDFSSYSEAAFQLACSLAKDHQAKIIVAHVFEVPTMVHGGVMTPPPPPVPAEQIEELKSKLHKIQPPDPAVAVEHRLLQGNPAQEILHLAQTTQCDLIVMGTHGRTGLRRLLMGSVAEKILREADCPVLTVKTRLTQ
jgi:nucleotide-binding universal stress UspA family protein